MPKPVEIKDTPEFMKPVMENVSPKIMSDTILITPSPQIYNSWTPEQKQEWKDTVVALKGDPDAVLNYMNSMIPREPSIRRK